MSYLKVKVFNKISLNSSRFTDGKNIRGIFGRLQPDQHSTDEVGTLYRCRSTCLQNWSYYQTTIGQCFVVGCWWQWKTKFDSTGCSYVSTPMVVYEAYSVAKRLARCASHR